MPRPSADGPVEKQALTTTSGARKPRSDSPPTNALAADLTRQLGPRKVLHQLSERLPEHAAGCILRLLPVNRLEQGRLDDVWSWNLARARAADALERIDVPRLPASGQDPCADVWALADDVRR